MEEFDTCDKEKLLKVSRELDEVFMPIKKSQESGVFEPPCS